MITDPQNLIAFVMPFLIDMVNHRVQDTRLRFLFAWGACIVAGIFLHLDLVASQNWDQLGANVVTIILTAQATYALYWKDSTARVKVYTAYYRGTEDGKK